jgi:O-antigen ligase
VGLAATCFILIPLLWREGYTWVILWLAPLAAFEPVPAPAVRAAKYALVAVALGIVLIKRRLEHRRPAQLDHGLLWPAVALLAWLWIRALTGNQPWAGTVEAARLTLVASLVYTWLSEPLRAGGRRRWYALWMIMGLFEATTCVIEASLYGQLRSYGTFPNANAMGTYLIMAVTVSFAASLQAVRRSTRRVSGLICGVLLFALYLTGARAAWLATAIALTLLVIMTRRWRFVIAGVVVLAAGAYIYTTQPLVKLAVDAALRLQFGLTHRPILWDAADRARIRAPLIGFGFEAAGEEMTREARYPTPVHRSLTAEMIETGSAHNFYRELQLETGLIGVALWALMVGGIVRFGWRVRGSPDPWRRIYTLSLLSVTGGFLAHAYFEHSVFLGSMSSAVFYWFLVAQTFRPDDPPHVVRDA